MNNIKILEELIQRCKEYKFACCEQCEINNTQVRAIENLIQENKELKEYKKIAELTKISCCTAQNCEALNNAIREGIIINKAIDYIGIDKETEECCDIFDVNGIELLKILRGEK